MEPFFDSFHSHDRTNSRRLTGEPASSIRTDLRVSARYRPPYHERNMKKNQALRKEIQNWSDLSNDPIANHAADRHGLRLVLHGSHKKISRGAGIASFVT